jgi:hypothetical protein
LGQWAGRAASGLDAISYIAWQTDLARRVAKRELGANRLAEQNVDSWFALQAGLKRGFEGRRSRRLGVVSLDRSGAVAARALGVK